MFMAFHILPVAAVIAIMQTAEHVSCSPHVVVIYISQEEITITKAVNFIKIIYRTKCQSTAFVGGTRVAPTSHSQMLVLLMVQNYKVWPSGSLQRHDNLPYLVQKLKLLFFVKSGRLLVGLKFRWIMQQLIRKEKSISSVPFVYYFTRELGIIQYRDIYR